MSTNEAGVEVELTRRGQAVVVVVSRQAFERLREKRGPFRDAYQRFLRRFSLEDIGLDPDDVSAGRDTTPGRRVTL